MSEDMKGSTTTCKQRGPRLVGPHGGLNEAMPNPTAADQADPLFEAIWQATKTWDVNVPEKYVGYCGMNGSHVMLILGPLRAALAARDERVRELEALRNLVLTETGEDGEGNMPHEPREALLILRKAARALLSPSTEPTK